jgi:hypothetical protein
VTHLQPHVHQSPWQGARRRNLPTRRPQHHTTTCARRSCRSRHRRPPLFSGCNHKPDQAAQQDALTVAYARAPAFHTKDCDQQFTHRSKPAAHSQFTETCRNDRDPLSPTAVRLQATGQANKHRLPHTPQHQQATALTSIRTLTNHSSSCRLDSWPYQHYETLPNSRDPKCLQAHNRTALRDEHTHPFGIGALPT